MLEKKRFLVVKSILVMTLSLLKKILYYFNKDKDGTVYQHYCSAFAGLFFLEHTYVYCINTYEFVLLLTK